MGEKFATLCSFRALISDDGYYSVVCAEFGPKTPRFITTFTTRRNVMNIQAFSDTTLFYSNSQNDNAVSKYIT